MIKIDKDCPKCGQSCRRDDASQLEKLFGYRGKQLQSYCRGCRSNKKREAPHDQAAQNKSFNELMDMLGGGPQPEPGENFIIGIDPGEPGGIVIIESTAHGVVKPISLMDAMGLPEATQKRFEPWYKSIDKNIANLESASISVANAQAACDKAIAAIEAKDASKKQTSPLSAGDSAHTNASAVEGLSGTKILEITTTTQGVRKLKSSSESAQTASIKSVTSVGHDHDAESMQKPEKSCTSCGSFGSRRPLKRGGFMAICRTCETVQNRIYRENKRGVV